MSTPTDEDDARSGSAVAESSVQADDEAALLDLLEEIKNAVVDVDGDDRDPEDALNVAYHNADVGQQIIQGGE